MNVSSVIDQNVRNLPQAENAAKQLPFANKRPFPQVDQSPFQMSKTRDQLRHIPQSQSAHNLFSTKSHNSFSDSYAVVNGTHRPNKRHCFHEEDDDKENTHRHANTTPKRRESLGLGAFTASPESAKLNSMMMNLSLGKFSFFSL